ncbi:MAG: hypothetical protein DMD33_00885, partial [Gemmatimonadetes bacterium]
MSTVVAIAEVEAAIAEAELTDEEAELVKASIAEDVPLAEAVKLVLEERDGEGDQAPPTPVQVADLGEPSKEQLRALDREQTRHEKRIHEIMGPFVACFVACEECSGVGLTQPGPKPRTHELFKTCETCAGFGLVLTGSTRPGMESRDCPACLGRGYLEGLDAQGNALALSPSAP